MVGTYSIVTEPAIEPITLDEAKLHCRIDAGDENSIVTALIKIARQYVERITNRALITQTWELRLDDWPSEIWLTRPPVQSITSIKYLDTDGVEQTWSDALYQTDLYAEPARISPIYGESYPDLETGAYNRVIVRFVNGYGDAASQIPTPIIQSMEIMISHWFQNRELILTDIGRNAPIEIPLSAQALLAPYEFTRFP